MEQQEFDFTKTVSTGEKSRVELTPPQWIEQFKEAETEPTRIGDRAMKHYIDELDKRVEKAMDGQPRLDGKKNDEGKPQLGLVPKALIWAVGTILTFGAKKYGEHNWRKGLAWSRPYNALLRHLTAWWDGETVDAESGKSHLWHAATELAFLVEYEEKGVGLDDRYKV